MAYDGTLKFDTSIDGKGFKTGLKDIESTLSSAGRSLLPLSAGAALIAGSAINASIELEAMAAKYTTVFKGYTDVADAFIKDFQKLTPATTAQAQAFASGIQDLLVPMGFARDTATEMTGEFMHVIGALTNFNSGTQTAQSVTEKFQGALTGEFDGLKALGIQLDANTVKRRALELGLIRQGEEVSKQAIAQVVLQEAYKQSGDALTAYNEKNLDTKTKLELLKSEFLDAGAKMAESFLPVLTQIVDAARDAIDAFTGLPQPVQEGVLGILSIIAVLAPLLLLIGSLAGAITNISGLFKLFGGGAAAAGAEVAGAGTAATNAAGGVGLLGTALEVLSGPVGLAIAAVVGFIGTMNYLYETNESSRKQMDEMWEAVGKAPKKALDDIKKDLHEWKELGQNMLQGLVDGFVSVIDRAKESIKGGFVEILDSVKSLLGIHSPSTVFAGIGENMAEGAEIGWTKKIKGFNVRMGKDLSMSTNYVGQGMDSSYFQSMIAELKALKTEVKNQPYTQRNINRMGVV